MNIAQTGFGSWGTALALTLADKGETVRVTLRSGEELLQIKKDRENKRYLPGAKIPDNVVFYDGLKETLEGADTVIFAVPAQGFREALIQALPYMEEGAIIVNVAKGIELVTLMRMSEIASGLAADHPYVALSGPSHAEEVWRRLPTTVAAASRDPEAAKKIQSLFMTDRFRVYTNDDVTGVETGGALKNIMALGAGISDGLGFGDNAKAALMTRGIVEITRLGAAIGAKKETFAGLTGIGDLIVTCTSDHSRNLRCGRLIGQGVKPQEAVKAIGMAVEGIYTCEAAASLAERMGVEMPITFSIHECLSGRIQPTEAIDMLMNRSPKRE